MKQGKRLKQAHVSIRIGFTSMNLSENIESLRYMMESYQIRHTPKSQSVSKSFLNFKK